MQELQVVKKNVGKTQQMYFLDRNGKRSRGNDNDGYFDINGAYEQVESNFNFKDGKHYIIKYLTNDYKALKGNDVKAWKGGKLFKFHEGLTDLYQHVYSAELSEELYDYQEFDIDDLHIFSIVVEEI